MSDTRTGISDGPRHAMPITVYVIEPDKDERQWLSRALAPIADTVVVLDQGVEALLAEPSCEGACLIAAVDPADAAATLAHVQRLRTAGLLLPVIALGPHSAFRTAVDIARYAATDFLERPVSAYQLRAALQAALDGVRRSR